MKRELSVLSFLLCLSFGKFCLFLVLLNRSSVSPRLLFPLASNRMTSMPCARVFNRTTSHLLPPMGIDFFVVVFWRESNSFLTLCQQEAIKTDL